MGQVLAPWPPGPAKKGSAGSGARERPLAGPCHRGLFAAASHNFDAHSAPLRSSLPGTRVTSSDLCTGSWAASTSPRSIVSEDPKAPCQQDRRNHRGPSVLSWGPQHRWMWGLQSRHATSAQPPDSWSLPTANQAPLTWALMGRGGPSSLPAEVSPPMLSEGPAHGVPLPVRVGRTWDLLHIVEPGTITLPYLRYLGGQPRGGAQRALPAHSQLDAGPLGPRLRKWSCPHQAGTIPLLGGPFMSTTGARRVANR